MSFEPKQKVDLDPPKDDVISQEYLSKCDGTPKFLVPFRALLILRLGTHDGYPTYVAIKVGPRWMNYVG